MYLFRIKRCVICGGYCEGGKEILASFFALFLGFRVFGQKQHLNNRRKISLVRCTRLSRKLSVLSKSVSCYKSKLCIFVFRSRECTLIGCERRETCSVFITRQGVGKGEIFGTKAVKTNANIRYLRCVVVVVFAAAAALRLLFFRGGGGGQTTPRSEDNRTTRRGS